MGDRATDDFELERRFSVVPVRGLLIGVGDAEDGGLIQGLPDDLQSDGEAFGVETAGHGEPWKACQVERVREDIRQIHLQGILGLLSNLECSGWRSRGNDYITGFEGLVEVVLDQSPNLLSLEIIGVVVAC